MASYSYRRWRSMRTRTLDEIAQAHAVIGGPARGRRFATQQLNRAYAVLLASQFQGFCRDLHSECAGHIIKVIAPPASMEDLLWKEFTRSRHLDRGNAQPSSLGADFGRLGVDLWSELRALLSAANRCKSDLELLNEWRNAIVHEDFTSTKLNGIINLRLVTVKRWRKSCVRLTRGMDAVMHQHLLLHTAVAPW